jgi:hypothetical protein
MKLYSDALPAPSGESRLAKIKKPPQSSASGQFAAAGLVSAMLIPM